MDGCIFRTKDGECDLYFEVGHYKTFCEMENCKDRKLTNADRIRAMTDEELASFACNRSCAYCPVVDCNGRMMTIGRDYCYKRWLDWLKQEADE